MALLACFERVPGGLKRIKGWRMPIFSAAGADKRRKRRFFTLCVMLTGTCCPAVFPFDLPDIPPAILADGLQCERVEQGRNRFEVVTVDLRQHQLQLYWKNATGTPYATIERLNAVLKEKGKELLFATNAGIYSRDYRPMGLHIEDGAVLQPLSRGSGGGNFFLKPNGVFFLHERKAEILETEAFFNSGKKPQLAVQSGPLLLQDSRIHPRFIPDSDSRHIRNGVGIMDANTVCFVLSRFPINFYEFASFFRDTLRCRDALYLDGSLSAMYASCFDRNPSGGVFVGILAITRPLSKDSGT